MLNDSASTKFNRLTLLVKDAGRSSRRHILSEWLCDCGTTVIAPYTRVKSGEKKSCGCFTKDQNNKAHIKHGVTKNGNRTREYVSWIGMRRRCLSPNDPNYGSYGGKGITVWPEWASDFSAFLAYMGPRPPNTTLDRIDSCRGYEPGNVRWATHLQQARNRHTTFIWFIKGHRFESAAEAAKYFSVSPVTIREWAIGGFRKCGNRTIEKRPDCYVESRYDGDWLTKQSHT